MAIQFEVGKTYSTRSACDHNCVYAYTVLSRTAKMLTIEDRHGRISKRGVRVSTYTGTPVEACNPQGSYSMAPVIMADDTREKRADWE